MRENYWKPLRRIKYVLEHSYWMKTFQFADKLQVNCLKLLQYCLETFQNAKCERAYAHLRIITNRFHDFSDNQYERGMTVSPAVMATFANILYLCALLECTATKCQLTVQTKLYQNNKTNAWLKLPRKLSWLSFSECSFKETQLRGHLKLKLYFILDSSFISNLFFLKYSKDNLSLSYSRRKRIL